VPQPTTLPRDPPEETGLQLLTKSKWGYDRGRFAVLFKGPAADSTGTCRPILTRSVMFLGQQGAAFAVSLSECSCVQLDDPSLQTRTHELRRASLLVLLLYETRTPQATVEQRRFIRKSLHNAIKGLTNLWSADCSYIITEFSYYQIFPAGHKQTPGLQSASELYRPSDRRLSAKLVPTLADRR
jgi:hypothetical protein